MDRQHGMTLIELLVALSVFLILGSSLVMFLRIGIDTWRIGEIRRETFERGQSIVDQIEDDLRSMYPNSYHGDAGEVDVLLLSDYDLSGRQRLRFVRSLAGETRHPITRRAGSLTGGFADYDFENDAIESRAGLLRATGGLQEVVYLSDPNPEIELLWRGVRSPIGGERSLLIEENVYPEDGGVRHCRPFADGILYLEYNFWGTNTISWTGQGGAHSGWDSTRGILAEEPTFSGVGSRHDPRDDVFPSRVQVVLVLRPARVSRFGRIRSFVDEDDDVIQLDNTQHYPEAAFPYVRIGSEWIRYETIRGRSLIGCTRGVRGTEAAEHPIGEVAVYGTTFSRVIRIPAARDSLWEDR